MRLPPTVACMLARWLIVLIAAVVLVGAPIAVGARRAVDSGVGAAELARQIQASAALGWSGSVRTTGSLQIPASDSFATLGELLGESTDLRVWWRNAEEWRVDRVRTTGETDLFRNRGGLIRWVFESEVATISPVSRIRLPDASDLLPPTLARSMLRGARPGELTRLPAERLAGRSALGLRLTPEDPATTIDHVDIWAEADSGLPLRVELFGRGDRRPVLTTTTRDLTLQTPDTAVTVFRPAYTVDIDYDPSVDVAAAANASAPYDLPATLAGLGSRRGDDPGAVGVYGRGPTTLIALPLRGQVAGPFRQRLRSSTAIQETTLGPYAPVGPVGILLVPFGGRGGAFLLAGTVTADTLQQAAAELVARG